MQYEQLAAFDFVAIMHLLVSYIVGVYCSNKDTVYQILKKFSRVCHKSPAGIEKSRLVRNN